MPEKLQNAAEQILADSEIQPGLQKIRQSFLEAGGVASAVAAIQSFKEARGIG